MTYELDPEFKDISTVKKLDQYYIPTRYPTGLSGGIPSRYYDDPKEAENAMKLARDLINLVEKKLELE